jgi:hypothetical protein
MLQNQTHLQSLQSRTRPCGWDVETQPCPPISRLAASKIATHCKQAAKLRPSRRSHHCVPLLHTPRLDGCGIYGETAPPFSAKQLCLPCDLSPMCWGCCACGRRRIKASTNQVLVIKGNEECFRRRCANRSAAIRTNLEVVQAITPFGK